MMVTCHAMGHAFYKVDAFVMRFFADVQINIEETSSESNFNCVAHVTFASAPSAQN